MKTIIDNLLNLQEKDIRLNSIEAKIKAVPIDIDTAKKEIKRIEENFKAENQKFLDMQKKADEMRNQRREIEAKIVKYRGQLLETKKNDDYIALNAEINKFAEIVSDMEGEEIQLLMDIDALKDELEAKKADVEAQIEKINGNIWFIKEALRELESDRDELIAERNETEKKLTPPFYAAYVKLRASNKKFPIVVKLNADQCGGCYLKISGESTRKIDDKSAPTLCEQCGRILYR